MADFGKLNFSVSFNPTSAFPLDARTYFEGDTALSDAQAAAAIAEEVGSTNTVYHYGMKLLVNQNGVYTWYKITTSNTLEAEGSASSGGGSSDLPAVSTEDDGKVLAVENGTWVAKSLPQYEGEYSVTPSTSNDVTLLTASKMMDANVTVQKVPYSEVTNPASGLTVTIGGD